MSIATLLALRRDEPPLPLEEAIPNSTGYWLQRLAGQLDAQIDGALYYERYYSGDHPMQFATSKFRETFGSLFDKFADNWCQVVVESSLERLAVQGFRFGSDESYAGDEAAWRIWQANNLDAESVSAHLESIKTGRAFVLVDAGDPPRITTESPLEVTIAYAPGNRARRVAALKRWLDVDGYWHATLYLPRTVLRFVSEEPHDDDAERLVWTPDDPAQLRNAFAPEVPMLELANAPGMIGGGRSDLQPVIPIQNAVDKLCTDMLVASEYAAFRQRWATGVEVPTDPTTGRPDSRYLTDASRLWTVPNDEARFGSIDVTDLGNYVKAVEMFVQHLAAQTRTPPHYLTAGLGQWPSGDSLKASEVGLVAKVKRKQLVLGDTWESAMRLAFKVQGDLERASDLGAETIWADPEYRSEGERVDALVKMRTLGVPLEALWQRWGVSPQEIKRWRDMLEKDVALLGAAAVPVATMTGMNAPVTAPPPAS